MEIIAYVLCGVLTLVSIGLGWTLYKSILMNQAYEELHEGIYEELNNLSIAIDDLLSREIFSDEPTVMRFVEVLQELQPFLQRLNPDLSFNLLGEAE